MYLNELIVYLNRAYLETSEEEIEADIENNPQISEIIRYINLNIDEELSLDKLATNFLSVNIIYCVNLKMYGIYHS